MVVDNIIANEFNTYYHIEDTDKWYVDGFTVHGCCGIDTNNDDDIIYEPQRIPFKCIEKIRTSDRRSFFITKDHELYVNGMNFYGELGIGDVNSGLLTQVMIDKVFDVYPMDYRTFIQTMDNKFYVCGVYKDDFSETFVYPHAIDFDEEMAKYKDVFPIRLPSGGWKIYNPPKYLPVDNIREVVSCEDRFFYVTKNGQVFYSGEGPASVFGLSIPLDPVITVKEARELPIQNVKMVKAGLYHTAILAEDGKLYVCGLNNKGQLGLGYHVAYTDGGISELAENVTFVEVGFDKTLYALKSGKIMYCGKGDRNELEAFTPVQLPWFTFSTKVFGLKLPLKRKVKYEYEGIKHQIIISYEVQDYDKIVMSSYINTPSINKITKIEEDVMFHFTTDNMDDVYDDISLVSDIRIDDVKSYIRNHTNYYDIPTIKTKTIIKLNNGSLIEVEGSKTKEQCIDIAKNYVLKKYNTIYDKIGYYNESEYDNFVDGNPIWEPNGSEIHLLTETNKNTYNTY